MFFFFQAEDGIRDVAVTGVQTCALPICVHQRPHQRGSPVSQQLTLTPAQIVTELDRYIVGQERAKRAVAIALRNRWRRQNLPPELRDEGAPKNTIMIAPTGIGKAEGARRLA